jgi:hypothetical protein
VCHCQNYKQHTRHVDLQRLPHLQRAGQDVTYACLVEFCLTRHCCMCVCVPSCRLLSTQEALLPTACQGPSLAVTCTVSP